MRTIGIKVKSKREEIGMSQKKLAKESGISRSYIIEIEEDKYKVSVDTLCKISKVFKCTPNDLIPEELYT